MLSFEPRKAGAIARSILIRWSRDKKVLALFLLMPMILIGILGSALSEAMGGKIQPFEVVVVQRDEPVDLYGGDTIYLGKILVNDVLSRGEAAQIIRLKQSTGLTEAMDTVSSGRAAVAIHIPSGFTSSAMSGNPKPLEIYSDPGRPTEAQIVIQIAQFFNEDVTSALLSGEAREPRSAAPKISEAPSGAKEINFMQYYAAAMAIMFMMITGLARAKDILTERQNGTLARILAGPTGLPTILAGQILGNLVLVLAQLAILMLGTRLLYGVDWGDPLPALLVGTSFAWAAAGIGTALAGILNDPKAADASVGLVSNLFTALSGGMFPLYIFPDSLRAVAKFIPNYWALQGFLDQMGGAGPAHLWPPVIILGLTGLVTAALGSWRLSAKVV